MAVCSHPEDGLRWRQAIKPPLKLRLRGGRFSFLPKSLMISSFESEFMLNGGRWSIKLAGVGRTLDGYFVFGFVLFW